MNSQTINGKTLTFFGAPDEGAKTQAINCMGEADAFCLMGDNHKGYGMPVGGVAVYKDKICPAGVGFDIACGNKAVRTDMPSSKLTNAMLLEISKEISTQLSFGVGRKNKDATDHPLFASPIWDDLGIYKDGAIKQLAREQLGTIGSGNHYVDVFYGDDGYVWVGVHFGSRGLGHKTASHYMQIAGDRPSIMDETPHTLDANSQIGQEYIAAMTLCGQYAYAGRDWVCNKVLSILGANSIDEIHNHHNFAWKEQHNGESVWVVRKGATPAFPNQKGFVGSSMGGKSVILQGVDSPESKIAYYSTVHGAGRVMSRTEAAGKAKWINGKPVRVGQGKVNWDAVKNRLANDGVILMGGGADEAPEVYKDLRDVLIGQGNTITVLHTLTPVIVCMAGIDEFDPYKD